MTIDEFNYGFVLRIPVSKYFNKVQGLCGNCDLKKIDDEKLDPTNYIIKDGFCEPTEPERPMPSPRRTPEESVSTASATTASLTTATPFPVCDKAESCKFLIDPEGAFKSCHPIVDPTYYYQACVHDICENGLETMCASAFIYAEACQRTDICLPWRNHPVAQAECPVTCAGEMEVTWTDCVSPCQKTYCTDDTPVGCEENGIYTSQNLETKDLVSKFLRCPIGETFDWMSMSCVTRCPVYCPHGTKVYKEGESFMDGCQSCECTLSGKVVCAKMACPTFDTYVCPTTNQPPTKFVSDSNGCCKMPVCGEVCTCEKNIVKPTCDNSCHEAILTGTDADCCPIYECQCPLTAQTDIPKCDGKFQELVVDATCCNKVSCQCNCPLDNLVTCPFGETKMQKLQAGPCNCQIPSCERVTDTCIVELIENESKLLNVGDTIDKQDSCQTCTCQEHDTLTCQTKVCSTKNTCGLGFRPQYDACGCVIENSCVQELCVYDKENGLTMKQNSTIQKDPCTVCTCEDDFCLTCETTECPDLGANCLQSVIPEGQCCPVCIQDNSVCQEVKTTTLNKIQDCVILDKNSIQPIPATFEMSYCAGSCDSEAYFDHEQSKFVSSCGCCNPKSTSVHELKVRCGSKVQFLTVEVTDSCHCNCDYASYDTCDAPTFAELFF